MLQSPFKLHEFDPVRVFASRILSDRLERAGLFVDAIYAHLRRQLSDCQQIVSRRIDIESTRLLLGLPCANSRERARFPVDAKRGKRARGPFRCKQETAVRRQMNVGAPGLIAGKIRWDDRDSLHWLGCVIRGIEGKNM